MPLGTASDTSAKLASLRVEAEVRQASLIREWATIAAWGAENVVAEPEGAATIREGFIDTGLPVAGDGAPLVSEFALMELAAVLGRSPDGGRVYVGQVLSCAWRLPNVWAAVMAGRLEPWRASRIATLTHSLSFAACAYVDRQLFNASGVSWAQLDRLIAEAIIRFDPERAETERTAAADQRYSTSTSRTATAWPASPGCWTRRTRLTSTTPSVGGQRSWAPWGARHRSMCGAPRRSASSPGPT